MKISSKDFINKSSYDKFVKKITKAASLVREASFISSGQRAEKYIDKILDDLDNITFEDDIG